MNCRAVATEPAVTCKVQVVPVTNTGADSDGGDVQKGSMTKSVSQGKLVQVTLCSTSRPCQFCSDLDCCSGEVIGSSCCRVTSSRSC